ncbi:N-acetylglucosamine-6-phosphate deacetylase [Bradyrhizobium sp. WYCCWR 13023]|uniref:N-acetylglucosamine-6-phosphate deacetylase n=1 Tax=Bradyrhizobium zhengyangense TaxID=2911009 RepID=A0A9X1R602_9BRAD|nr:N-acetylglucosamine-6-phosphate deacetylase [Bradyrhizobium zhengyangense]MCG2625625.1 N-acetylglucosamine-6-phosphate deacetylase [Bradyrhizobium zhengyangense]MCG2638239.1 N-acetylglucosamine-6-phosphate deacetylase [Bradyrhizobium zhengyangense]MCG2666638.1 N-acetylglucosamine-6-phosphate deacetylase [Bradyrhizobium zhengyangense]
MIVLSGARIFDGERFLDDHAVVVDGARIAAIVPHSQRPDGAMRDLGGGLLAPGYVDVQVNGGGGVLFNEDPTPEGIARIAAAHRDHGTIGLLPTLVTDTPQVMATAIAATREARRLTPAALGIHLEGPFLDPRRKGAHELNYIRNLEPDDIATIAKAECGAIMLTLAPNRVGAESIAELTRQGVLVSLGHSDATYQEARRAVEAGARAFTHLFNAMSPPTGREPGMVGAALDLDDVFVGLIADGHHVHEANLRVALAAKRHDRFMLITDAMPPAAGGPDHFDLQGRRVTSVDGCLRLDDGTLAGSVLTMDEAVRYAVNVLRLPLANALAMASRIPATFLRRDTDLGRIAPGYLASLVHLDDELRVQETWIEGCPLNT